MDQETRNKLQRATQRIRRLLEDEFAEQLEGTFDILQTGRILPRPGKHLDELQRLTRQKLVDAIEHIKAGGKNSQEAVDEYTREAAFTFLNRFVALRMLETRGLLQECVSKGDASSGFKEFCGLAPGLSSLEDGGYRLYLECLFDELTVEVKLLFDRRDSASLLWPRRGPLTELFDILGQADLANVWSEDETIGWVYQYFNSGEERKKMREESQAPRNSRELAVRNQFFTPRYVVEFLTDNTLGCIWHEMRKGDTRLVDECEYLVRRPSKVFLSEGQNPPEEYCNSDQDLSQEVFLQKEVYVPHRVQKDPRDLKILDPACGSGHFLLYAFDLLITIYEEAWHDESSPKSEATGNRLRDDYTDLKQLHTALPGLVLGHNLHGIDIDPRAAQIAALALWMRGQRAFNDFQILRKLRPPIARSNIVCAEPMPGEAAFLDEFIAQHLSGNAESRFLASLVRKVFDAMQLAGEAGSLLKIEEDIADDVAKAKKQWLERPEYKQQTLFDNGSTTIRHELELTSGITDESFWGEAEQRIYEALRVYSEQAERSSGFQRRLFAADAARGFAFIDLCRQHYDVALMNPPFGQPTKAVYDLQVENYHGAHSDLFASFIRRSRRQCNVDGKVGAITSRAFLVAARMEDFRRSEFLCVSDVMADFGLGVMDEAFVEACAFVCNNERKSEELFVLDARRAVDKRLALRELLSGAGQASIGLHKGFESITGAPILYNIPHRFFAKLAAADSFEPAIGTAREGMRTFDDTRFLRLTAEVSSDDIGPGKTWTRYAKGGEFALYVGDFPLVVSSGSNSAQLDAVNIAKNGSYAQVRQASAYWYRAGATYSRRSAKGFSCRILPEGFIISDRGPAILSESDVSAAYIIGWLNSALMRSLVHLQASASLFTSGVIKALPWQYPTESDRESVERNVRQVVDTLQAFQQLDELSPSFSVESIVFPTQQARDSYDDRCSAAVRDAVDAYVQISTTIDALYEIDSSDLAQTALGEHSICNLIAETLPPSSLRAMALRFVSATFGRCFGRWNDERHDMSPSVIVDDDGVTNDIISQFRDALRVQVDDSAAAIEQLNYAVASKSSDFRSWFRVYFFDYHLGDYTRSRRKAPIYWQLATPSSAYSVWLYYHHLSKDTFFQVLNEFVKPKLNHARQKLDRLQGEAGVEPSRSQHKKLEDQERFVIELALMLEEVERIAPLWNPNLNDGVIINFAPLWRLVPQNKSWQKECKSCWDKLVKGDYDWAHLAMHLWPERVVPKCVTDASLAIAHGLENVFWEQDDRERFQPKDGPDGGWEPTIERLVKERSSPAVKAALQSLLDAPVPSSSSGRSRRRRTGS